MPGALCRGHELDDGAVAADEEMRRDPHAADVLIPWMLVEIQRVAEKIDDGTAAEDTGWQADVVQHEQCGVFIAGARVMVG